MALPVTAGTQAGQGRCWSPHTSSSKLPSLRMANMSSPPPQLGQQPRPGRTVQSVCASQAVMLLVRKSSTTQRPATQVGKMYFNVISPSEFGQAPHATSPQVLTLAAYFRL